MSTVPPEAPARAREAQRTVSAGERMDQAAAEIKAALVPLSEAMTLAPAELLQDLADANLNAHHALGRLNSARAMLRRAPGA